MWACVYICTVTNHFESLRCGGRGVGAVEVGKQCVSNVMLAFALLVCGAVWKKLKLKVISQVSGMFSFTLSLGARQKATWSNISQRCGFFVFHHHATRMSCFRLEREKKRRDPLTASYPFDGKRATLFVQKKIWWYFSRISTESCGMEGLSGLILNKKGTMQRAFTETAASAPHTLWPDERMPGEKKRYRWFGLKTSRHQGLRYHHFTLHYNPGPPTATHAAASLPPASVKRQILNPSVGLSQQRAVVFVQRVQERERERWREGSTGGGRWRMGEKSKDFCSLFCVWGTAAQKKKKKDLTKCSTDPNQCCAF